MNTITRGLVWFFSSIVAFTIPAYSASDSQYAGSNSLANDSLLDELRRGFQSRISIFAFGITQDVKANSPLNPNNALRLSRYQAVLNPRVDLNLDFRRLELGVKGRLTYQWERFEDGAFDGVEDDLTQAYVNEWFARYRVSDKLFVSYGRENLQWGPSVLLSSSNPFFKENGRNNTQVEVPGLGYARAVWIPDANWSLSFIANLDRGRLGRQQLFGLNQGAFVGTRQGQGFQRAYALKLDWTGDGKYASFIPAYREETGYRFGAFGGWNVSDALLLYAEGAKGQFEDVEFQAGASFTFEGGDSVNVEYYHNGNGCTRGQLADCFRFGELNTLDPLFRSEYIALQYTDTKVWRDLNVNLRAIHDISDQSARLIANLEYEATDHTLLYLIANGFLGDRDTEYGSLLNYSLFLGGSYTF